jgi:hypothetical protein
MPTGRAYPHSSRREGVAIGVGDDAQRVVDAHPAGTIYLVGAGTHLCNF